MPVETIEDQRALLEDFGEEVVLFPDSQATSITAIFAPPHERIDLLTGVFFSSEQPTIFALTQDLTGNSLSQRDPLRARGTDYTVADIQAQDDGVFSLVLLHAA